MPTPTEIFSEVQTAFDNDPSKAKGLDAAYLFDVTGEGGGPYHIVVKDGAADSGPGAVENPNLTVTVGADDLSKLRTGQLDGTMAFMSGKLKIRGDMGLAMRLQSILR